MTHTDGNTSRQVMPLPITKADLIAQRTVKILPNLNDAVDEIFVHLWETANGKPEDEDGNVTIIGYMQGVWDEDCREGSRRIDDVKAAELIKEYARENNIPFVGGKNLKTIMRAMSVVARRYKVDPKHRRDLLHGEHVPNGKDEDDDKE